MKENKKQIVIATSVLVATTILLLGLTYAYYKTRINGNTKDKSISVTSKKLAVSYADGNGVIEGTGIEPGYTVTKTFTVENTGDETLSYSIKLDNITNTFTRTEDWTYVLKKGDVEVSSGTIVSGSYQILVPSTSIDVKVTDDYTLTITYANLTDVDQSIDMGATLSLRVNIDEAKVTWNSAPEETLLYAIKNDNTVTDPLTTPGAGPSNETEAVLSSTEDDYGTSYYFRGNVKNNFVNFSGMCWRIVRVQGDGSIKITLADRDHECNSDDYGSAADAGFLLTDTFNYKSDTTNTSDDLKYETSDIKIVLEAWFNGGDYTSGSKTGTFEKKIDDTKLVETEWCNDMSVSSKIYRNNNGEIIDDASKAVYTFYNYGAHDRMYTTKTPTLKCNMTGLDNTKSLKIKSKVGTLTVDEIAFAGGDNGGSVNNYTYYLNRNSYGIYWTMSPDFFEKTSSSIWYVYVNGNFSTSQPEGNISVRPALVLRSDVEITSGDGTQSNPYIVK